MVGKLDNKSEKTFEQMLIVDSLRGTDSTGVLAVAGKDDYGIAKQVGDPYNLFSDRRYGAAMAGLNKVLIGHNRWGTVGKATKANAHPFEFDSLVGVHNGTLDNKYALDDANSFNVDSEALYHHMDKHGVREAIELVRGAWSLVWWEKEARKIHFLRNKERPMNLCWDEKEEQLFFASEYWMLEGILWRNGIKHKDIWELKVDTHLSMHVGVDGTINNVETEEIKGAPPFQAQQRGVVYPVRTGQHAGTNSTATTATKDNAEKQHGSTEQSASDKTGQKALEVAPWKDAEPNVDADYIKSNKLREFEYICKARDENGQDYCILFDDEHPKKMIRLYVHTAHNLQLQAEGTRIKGSVQSVINSQRGIFYKVSPYSVSFDVDQFEDEDEIVDWEAVAAAVGVSIQPEELVKDKDGTYMSQGDFLKIHPTCDGCGDAWYNGELLEKEYKFSFEGNIFCATCVNDYEGMVNFV